MHDGGGICLVVHTSRGYMHTMATVCECWVVCLFGRGALTAVTVGSCSICCQTMRSAMSIVSCCHNNLKLKRWDNVLLLWISHSSLSIHNLYCIPRPLSHRIWLLLPPRDVLKKKVINIIGMVVYSGMGFGMGFKTTTFFFLIEDCNFCWSSLIPQLLPVAVLCL